MTYKRIPGTRDILPQEIGIWQFIESTCRDIFSLYNFCEIRPPLLEDATLFNRSLGDTTEVVQKQMFLIHNKEDTYALRPEATASICRAYIENSLDKTEGLVKLYYSGPMFRFERPQKGRQRQFHQFGCEIIGTNAPAADIEIIALADTLLKKLSISAYTIKINSLGCSDDRKKLNELIRQKLQTRTSDLCEECRTRFSRNIMRILDCKNPQCQGIVASLNINHEHLCTECMEHFSAVRRGLDGLNISYSVQPLLVRGLDYYTRTVFEISQQDLGAQDAVGAGGRYDSLIKDLDGPDTGAIGFAFGIERIILAMNSSAAANEHSFHNNSLVFVIGLGDNAKAHTLNLTYQLRNAGIATDTDYEGKSLKGALRRADALKARFVLILGDNELQTQSVTVKDMIQKTQEMVGLEKITEYLKNKFEANDRKLL